jgi:hypothetical protein
MGQTTDQIETHIEQKREDLSSNLEELEQRVKSVTDWRDQFKKNPMTMIGIALGGGVLLATMISGNKRSRNGRNYANSRAADLPGAVSIEKRKVLDTWDTIKGAMVGVAATKVKDFLAEVVPDFDEHFQKTERDKANLSHS